MLLLTFNIVCGEAANHGIVDAVNLLGLLTGASELLSRSETGSLRNFVATYEDEMVGRTRPAAVRAHKACLDASHFDCVQNESFFVTKRQMKFGST